MQRTNSDPFETRTPRERARGVRAGERDRGFISGALTFFTPVDVHFALTPRGTRRIIRPATGTPRQSAERSDFSLRDFQNIRNHFGKRINVLRRNRAVAARNLHSVSSDRFTV